MYSDLRDEVEETKRKLEERKVIERAKGIIMVKNNMNEEEAYKHMRDLSMQKRISMSKLSDIIISTEVWNKCWNYIVKFALHWLLQT